MKATSQASRNGSVHCAKAPSIATRRRSRGMAKPCLACSAAYRPAASAAGVSTTSSVVPATSRRLAKYSTFTFTFIVPASSGTRPEVALAAALAQQLRRPEHDRVRQRLAHVVDGERGDGRAGKRFHFHAGAMGGLHRALDAQLTLAMPGDGDAATFDRQRMAERD